ncbi:DHA2 family efflux MFS transporter permease subunit [Nocardioides sp. BP30]|uniref:DHA2 family efflux MFS transporter permease subunit n=1 Tax=Nocardioides sp. BP30 TaxID=3036374 RepID=UPI002469103A|nr:DHA2 family efflux MFS transporter permease subunit [Nocardioides sp. BP30]WGL50622.1 DHA2 family efflux MFS transporter permease subunit [Nocardioides sp. BP30]
MSLTTAVPGATPTDAPRADRRAWTGLGLLAAAQFMVVLDASIVNIALPDMGTDLSLRPGTLAWVITAYVIAFGGLLPLGGRLADLLGRRRLFVTGVGVFSLASLAAGLAPTGAVLIGTRAVQGLGAALLAPAALSLVTTLFAEGAERTKALAIWGAVAAGGGAAGVLLGGLLTGGFGWRSVFLVNIPVGAAVLALIRRYVDEPARPTERLTLARFDLPGALTVTGGLVALVTALSQGDAWGWGSTSVLGLFAASTVLLVTFVAIERRSRHALVPMRLFTVRTVSAGNAVMLLVGAAMLGLFYFLSLYEQIVLGYGAVTAGLSQLPLALALIVAAGVAAPLMMKLSTPTVLTGALLTFAVGLGWLSLADQHGTFLVDILGPSLLIGLGLGAAFVPVTSLAVAGVPATDNGVAGGLVNTSQQVGGAIGLAALAALANGRTSSAVAAGHDTVAALTSGYAAAFLGTAGIALLAAAVTLLAVRRSDRVDAVAPTH